jgi:hypothetical protein
VLVVVVGFAEPVVGVISTVPETDRLSSTSAWENPSR